MSKRIIPIEKAKLNYQGLSMDGRTNRWSLHCICGKSSMLRTTMLATDSFECGRCNRKYFLDYNNEIVKEIKDEPNN